MASWNGNFENNGKEQDVFVMKLTPAKKLSTPRPPEQIAPDSEVNVEGQTEVVFRNFVYQRYRNDNIQQAYDNGPFDPELVNVPRDPDSSAAQVGRHLARIGDDVYERHRDTFDRMIRFMNIDGDADGAYEAFAEVARTIFADGIHWGRIVTLMCFGYRMAIQLLAKHLGNFASFLHRICRFVMRFLIDGGISQWIANGGGWPAALSLSFISEVSTKTVATITCLAAVSVIVVIVWKKYFV